MLGLKTNGQYVILRIARGHGPMKISMAAMKDEIRDILQTVLQRRDQAVERSPETDLNRPFVETLINYAEAKLEPRDALARIRETIATETGRPFDLVDDGAVLARFVNLLRARFDIGQQDANDLFKVLQRDAE